MFCSFIFFIKGTNQLSDHGGHKDVAGLDKRDYVERYAWFSFSPTDYKNGGSGLLNHYEGKITDLGYLYQKLGMPKGYDRNNPVKAKANPKEDVIKKYYITLK